MQVLKLFLEKSVKTSNLRSDYSMTAFNSVTTIICGMELGTVKNSGHHLIETVQVVIVNGNSWLKACNLNFVANKKFVGLIFNFSRKFQSHFTCR